MLGENNLYATHLAIVLAAGDRLDPGRCDTALHTRLAEHLAERSLASPDGIARTFPSSMAVTPTDQAAVLYALHRYDQAHDATLSAAPLAKYLVWLDRARRPDGLLPNEVTHTTANAHLPRGSSMTWAVRYLATVAPQAAGELWTATRDQLVVRVGPLLGVREWPMGVDHPADIDSGPIVSGIGASATSFGIGASRAVGDVATFRSLRRTERVGRLVASGDAALAAARDSALATAISINQRSLCAWEPFR